MHRRSLLILAALVVPAAFADEPFVHEVIREFEMPRDRLFDTAVLWLADTARSSKSVIDLKDKELGTIIGTASVSLSIAWGVTVPMSFKIRIDVKDNRYRLTFSQVTVNFTTATSQSSKRIEHLWSQKRKSDSTRSRMAFTSI